MKAKPIMIIIGENDESAIQIQNEWKQDYQIEVYPSLDVFLDGYSVKNTQDQWTQDATLSFLSELMNTRNVESDGHLFRTQKYMEILSTYLHTKNPDFIHNTDIPLIVQASRLHDIGKIGIPDSILSKPSRLTPSEFDIMKNHTLIGMNVIQKHLNKYRSEEKSYNSPKNAIIQRYLTIAGEIILSHHERWDGEGYPEGISKNEIPASARMMALIDVFDALTTPRIYKKEWNIEDTIHYILQQSGKQFDPEVVDAFVATSNQFISIYTQYSKI